MPDYYFFLSYARGDDRDSVRTFFNDLSAEVRTYAGLPTTQVVGFLDVEMQVGEEWARTLVSALGNCRTFVALISPRYLISEPCGREWTLFSERLDTLEQKDPAADPPPLIPLLWLPPPRLPAAIEARQYLNHGMPEAYSRTGLRQIIRLARYRDDYLEMLARLAQQIVEVATSERPVPTRPSTLPFEQVRSAFHDAGRPALPGSGPVAQVEFIIAAPARSDLDALHLSGLERDPQFYGELPEHWAPYRPHLTSPIADRAQQVALEHQFQALVTDLDSPHGRFGADRDTAERIVVLLVDLWVTGLTRHRSALARFDEGGTDEEPARAAAVLVPAGHDDEQTQANLTQLIAALGQVFGRQMNARLGASFRSAILSPQSFDADLGVILERSRNRMFRTNTVRRPLPGRSGQRPILRGP
ncbi:TIR-like protein FxsC [Actinoplanes regularis]|uniref:FxsC C-terminal domain-containing protein n=1 Tax=Actinoplanes regularis TaxID=52697 RepID=A0A238WPY1_9ACTN|nr:TIR-like protein FxsC [Actinoplanes regularis]GIE84637.1 hypothetical protein Are01nite_11170 [Actinoplanes regularis]SNR48660.1 FxsC C-terminal domain-containing protein [Actinoplanes regularis]